jgi:murein DD-endopeptidase MepM/ murein hydrolase activator NlpD
MPSSSKRGPLRTRRDALRLLALAPASLLLGGCLGSDDPEVRVIVDGQVVPPGTSTPAAPLVAAPLPFSPTPPPSTLDPRDLRGFTMPVAGACLPSNERLMPNAPRAYRHGVHEGVDFYFGDSCVVIDRGTPVLAMYEGVVMRADHDYVPLDLQRVNELAQRTARQGFTDEEALDAYRGRQVWVDHGNGVATRYCHLDEIEQSIAPGITVRAGQRIGGIGESGTPESVTAPGTELHLHFEVRVGDGFLGQDLPPEEVRTLYVRLFSPG